jgi:site-specific recombinase XerD
MDTDVILVEAKPIAKADLLDLDRLAEFLRLNVAEGDASAHTLRTYMTHIRQFFGWCYDMDIHPATASRDDMISFRRFLVEEMGYKRGTIAYKLNSVRRFYEAARAWGFRTDNPAEGLRAPKDPTGRRDRILERYLSPEDVQKLLAAPPTNTLAGVRDRAILRLMYFHGLRVSEVTRMDMGDLAGGQPFQVRIRKAKGGKDRSVFLVKSSLASLKAWLGARQGIDNVDRGTSSPVFVSLDRPTHGTRLTTEGVRWIVDGWLVECDLKRPGVSCHALRHAHATHVAMKKPEILLNLSGEMGHASITTTQAYLHVAQALTENPASVLEE